jgi:hypothetical protein
VWSCWKNRKPSNIKTNCSINNGKKQGKEEDHVKDGQTSLK